MKSVESNSFEGEDSVLSLRVLGYQVKGGKWAAHCLETDLVGYGKTLELALTELRELTEMQVSFAFFKNQPAILDRPAPVEIHETYNTLMRSVLQSFTVGREIDKKRRLASIPWPSHPNKASDSFVQA